MKFAATRGGTAIWRVKRVCPRKKSRPKAARQKAVSSGVTPSAMQTLESTPTSDQKKAVRMNQK